MTIFDYLNSILFSKKKIELNCDDESQFSVFMVNRWSSFYAKDAAIYINQTSNTYANLFNSKQPTYDNSRMLRSLMEFGTDTYA